MDALTRLKRLCERRAVSLVQDSPMRTLQEKQKEGGLSKRALKIWQTQRKAYRPTHPNTHLRQSLQGKEENAKLTKTPTARALKTRAVRKATTTTKAATKYALGADTVKTLQLALPFQTLKKTER